jgi:hypothetical protein
MTRFCRPYPELVGPRYWLPPEPFEFGWASPVGCNGLRCEGCGERVRAEVLPGDVPAGGGRRYRCACRQHDETGVTGVGGDADDLYPPALAEWVCGGHPELALPATLDGVRLDSGTDWEGLAADAALAPPFVPPHVAMGAVWLTRLYRLLGAERPLLSRAVAGLLDSADPRLVQGAYLFFQNERAADGAELVAPSVTARRDWLGSVPDPDRPSVSLLDHAALVLHRLLLAVDEAGRPVDSPALRVAEELALDGFGPGHAPHTFADHDPEWLRTHAEELMRANPAWRGTLLSLLGR